jgi:hypothetical protein
VLSNASQQPIAGVSAGKEAEIMTTYPSIASTALGQRIGSLCDAVPLRTNGVPWGRLLIAVPLWFIVVPFAISVALFLYAILKLFGRRYVLTNQHVQIRQLVGVRTFAQVSLGDIKHLVIKELPGQSYYKAADIVATAADGKTLLRLEGVTRPIVFRQTILEAQHARSAVAESLKTIQARTRS